MLMRPGDSPGYTQRPNSERSPIWSPVPPVSAHLPSSLLLPSFSCIRSFAPVLPAKSSSVLYCFAFCLFSQQLCPLSSFISLPRFLLFLSSSFPVHFSCRVSSALLFSKPWRVVRSLLCTPPPARLPLPRALFLGRAGDSQSLFWSVSRLILHHLLVLLALLFLLAVSVC